MKLLVIIVFLGVLLNGEAAPDASYYAKLAREHVFMVDRDGRSCDPAVVWGWTNNVRGYSVKTSLRWLSAGLTNWWATNSPTTHTSPPPRVVVFVHGGMNPYSAGKDRLMNTELMDSLAASNCYPIFIVWNSGPFSAYGEHLFVIRQGENHKWTAWATSPFMLVTDVARGVARLPRTLCGRFNSDLEAVDPHTGMIKFSDEPEWEQFEPAVATNEFHTFRPPRRQLGPWWSEARWGGVPEYVLTLPTKIVTLPLLDGLGTESWDIMLRRTRTMFEPTASYDISHKVKGLTGGTTNQCNAQNFKVVDKWLNPVDDISHLAGTNDQTGAMTFFCQQLVEWSATNFTELPFEFYGHSMGTIVLNQMFRNRPEIRAERIGYLAAACSIEDFKTALFPYLTLHTNTQFYNLSLHRERERAEFPLAILRVWVLRDLIARGSLLNWIDDILAQPNTISDRTLGAWDNITKSLPDIPKELRGRTWFRGCEIEPDSPFSLSSLTGAIEPQVHGDFTKSIFWSKDFLWPASTNQLALRPE